MESGSGRDCWQSGIKPDQNWIDDDDEKRNLFYLLFKLSIINFHVKIEKQADLTMFKNLKPMRHFSCITALLSRSSNFMLKYSDLKLFFM